MARKTQNELDKLKILKNIMIYYIKIENEEIRLMNCNIIRTK